eukprot:Clim_evm14s153 gene=Clim_evmTU14s153
MVYKALQRSKLDDLREKEADLLSQLAELKEQMPTEEAESLKQKIHDYNEAKDLGQKIFGQLAELRMQTVKEVHKHFGVSDLG